MGDAQVRRLAWYSRHPMAWAGILTAAVFLGWFLGTVAAGTSPAHAILGAMTFAAVTLPATYAGLRRRNARP